MQGKSAINEEIRQDDKIRRFICALIRDEIKSGVKMRTICREVPVNTRVMLNYYNYTYDAYICFGSPETWPRAITIRKLLRRYGYDLAVNIVPLDDMQ